MAHKLFSIVLPFLLPFIGYALYVWLQRLARRQEAESGHPPAWSGPAVGWLALAGALCVAAALVTFRFVEPPGFLQADPAALQAPPTRMPAEAE
jgi:hypothetical protein